MRLKSWASKLLLVPAFALGLVATSGRVSVSTQAPFLVYGSASGAAQAIKATSNALWVSIQSAATLPLTAAGSLSWTGRSILTSPADGVLQMTNAAATGFTRLIFGTNDATTSGASWNLNSGVLEAKTGDASAFTGIKVGAFTGAGGNLVLSTPGGKFTTYNGVNTAGVGLPAIYGYGDVAAATNTGTASIAAYTAPAVDGTYNVGCNILVTTSTTHSFSCDVTYTDEGNSARTMVLPMTQLAGTFLTSGLITNVTGAGPYESPKMTIRVKASTTITVRTSAGGTFTTVVYNARGYIQQIS